MRNSGLFTLFLLFSVFNIQAAGLPLENSTERLIIRFKADAGAANGKIGASNRMSRFSQKAGMSLTQVRATDRNLVVKMPIRVSLADARGMAARIATEPGVEYVEVDRWVKPYLTPNDPYYASQWHYHAVEEGGIGLPKAWNISTGDSKLVVAVVDTGITPHPEFEHRLLPGYDLISDKTIGNDGDSRDSDAADPGDWSTRDDICGASSSTWHGTHVAGTLAANSDNGQGVAGINWQSKILPVRALGRCGGYLSDIADGIRWAAGLDVWGATKNPNPARVINLSLGGSGACGYYEQEAVREAAAAGAVVIVASGNEGHDVSQSTPANCSGVIAVTAVNRAGSKAYYANSGELIDIAAPGGEYNAGIWSTFNDGQTKPGNASYTTMTGTSMAAPHVAGVVSLMLSVNPFLTPAEIETLLKKSARPFPKGTSRDCSTSICGAGILDAEAALIAAGSNYPPVVDAGVDARVNPGEKFTLAASVMDKDGRVVSQQWRQTNGTAISLSDAALLNPSFIAPMVAGELVFELTATDDQGMKGSDEVTVKVNSAPFADAGSDFVAATGTNVFLNGLASRDDDGITTYMWKQLSGKPVTLSNAADATPFFKAPVSNDVLVFELTVTDTDGRMHTDEVAVILSQAPYARAGSDLVVNPGTWVMLDGSQSYDEDGAISQYQWQPLSGAPVLLSDSYSATAGFVAPAISGNIELQLTVTDDKGLVSRDKVVVYVNAAPVVNLGNDKVINPGEVATLLPQVLHDVDGEVSSFEWVQVSGPAVEFAAVEVNGISFTVPDSIENIVFTLRATDNLGLSAADEIAVIINHAPVANAGEDLVVNPGQSFSLSGVLSSDSEGNIAGYSWQQLNVGDSILAVNEGANLNVLAPQVSGTYEFELSVTDELSLRSRDVVKVRVNEAPVVKVTFPEVINPTQRASLNAAASFDNDGDALRYQWRQSSGVPVELDNLDQLQTGFVTPISILPLEFELTVTDAFNLSSVLKFSVNVNQLPVADAGVDSYVFPGQKVTLNAAGSRDAEAGVLMYRWKQQAGISVNVDDVALASPSFTAPAQFGLLRFQVDVSDELGLVASDTVSVMVESDLKARIQVPAQVLPGANVQLQFDAAENMSQLEWQQLSGVSVAVNKNTAGLQFTAPQQPGSLLFIAQFKNAFGKQGMAMAEVKVQNVMPQLSVEYLYATKLGEALNFTVDAADLNGKSPVLEMYALPKGAQFDSLSGAFQWSSGKAGSYEMVLLVKDAHDPYLYIQKSIVINVESPGVVHFFDKSVMVYEQDGGALLSVVRAGGVDGEWSLDVIAANAGASELDYRIETKAVQWLDHDGEDKVIKLMVFNDGIAEGPERFYLRLRDPLSEQLIDEVEVIIVDADSSDAGYGEMLNTSAHVSESTGELLISVSRKGGTHGYLRVPYYTMNGAATSGEDFLEADGELVWMPGDHEDKLIRVHVVDDKRGEGDESFSVVLAENAGANNRSNIVIKDNDQMCFVATAAYGSGMASDVRFLRAFRDEVLLNSAPGQLFVKWYYRLSPPAADFIAQHDGLRSFFRAGLQPLVSLSKLLVSEDTYEQQTSVRP